VTDDIVQRLRQWTPADCWACDSAACWNRTPADRWTCESPECWNSVTPSCECTCHIHFGKEAADEIERLRAEVARLEESAGNWGLPTFDQILEALQSPADNRGRGR